MDHFEYPLRCAPLLWRPLVCLHPVPILLSVLQEPPCPAPTFLDLLSLSRTLCSCQLSLCPPPPIYLFPVQMCALLSHVHPCFVPLSFPRGLLQALPAQNALTLLQIPGICLAFTAHFFKKLTTYLSVSVAELSQLPTGQSYLSTEKTES